MSAHKIVVSVVAIAAAAAAGAGARSSTDTNISTFSKNSRTCCDVPEDDWPYGYQWRAAPGLTKKKSLLPSASNALRRLSRFGVGL